MATSPGPSVGELAWLAAGAAAGGLARLVVDHTRAGQLGPRLLLTAAAAMLIGFAFVAPIRAQLRTLLMAIGGAAASISVVATQAASATPGQLLIGLGAFFLCVLPALLLGMLAALPARRNARQYKRD